MRTGLLFLSFALLFAACAKKTPIDPAASWVSTLEFTCDRWLGNRVPARFVRETVKSATKALEKTAKSTNDRTAAETIRVAIADANTLSDAVERDDRQTVARVQTKFAAAYATLHKIDEEQK